MERYSGREKVPDSDAISGEVLRVGVRVPPFWPEDPTLWFAQIEHQFELSRITADETKFYYLASQLEHQYAKEVRDIIKNPPATDKYLKLKTELIRRLSVSQQQRLNQLAMHEELGDRKPSQFLRHLQTLAGPSAPSDFLCTLWTGRLPQNIQTVIATQMEDLPLEKLAELADKVFEIAPPSPQVASTSAAPAVPPHYDILTKQISELTRQVAMLNTMVNQTHHSRSRSRSRSQNRSRSRSRPRQPPADHPYCFYHFTYGSKARKCKSPCKYSSENYQGCRK
ncbi:uncharacterized protein LOC119693005 [Plutella xylostella]|uniref:uncharacterized protein LOC119693005 n=1 Tax=Plutella xylostella TaxID=51655 RepID=UPI0020329194|nr:uncharacterized protein LOC119693005 [Plutella xylostella]